ncbi:paired immunoglobulin-like type 2 receptor alpha [Sorex fumeus]|uniref:paired immunoglobulin-like type 2 receptor alpha n=1 Tax=Sorex fumeus TaxID=62283 RepID=UPI0024ADFEB6|nr:paired immunoglobulin-like type 2 receptor alpha [Sorex fumeus]
MGLAPLLLLLLALLASLLNAAPENCGNQNFGVDQQKHLEAPEGGSIRIPCSFHHSWEVTKNPEVRIAWRWKNFHGDFIYNQTLSWTHEEFKDRLHLDWTQGQTRGALLIWNLRRQDTSTYFCRVWLNTKTCGPQVFQSIQGTKLSVTPAAPENCNTGHGINQQEHLEALEGGSIRIPCSFHHNWELAENPEVKIGWRWKHLNGDFIYKQTLNWDHKEFKDRLRLDWTQGQTEGALLIWNLQRRDTTTYFCQVTLNTKRCGKRVIQSIRGTKLSVTPATKTTQGPTSTAATTGVDTSVNKGDTHTGSSPLSPGTLAGVAAAGAVLGIAILGLILYLSWKRSKGSKAAEDTPARESLQNTECKYENVENKGHRIDAKLDPTDDGITYASLSLSQLTSPAEPSRLHPHRGPQEETLYSTLKT